MTHKAHHLRGSTALVLLASVALGACSPAATSTPAPVTVRVSMMPILESLPTYIAEAQGYFADAGIAVQLVPVASAAERDQLIAAGQIDMGISDMVATALTNKSEPRLVIVRLGRSGSSQFATYRILAAASSAIYSVQDLRGAEIALSQATVIQYVTERMLQAEGLAPDEYSEVAVPSIADRMAVLASGKVAAATLPDPLASVAMQQGARVIVDDTKHTELGNSIFFATTEFLGQHPDAVRAFLVAIERAVNAINTDKASWIGLALEKKLIPAPLAETYLLPDFPAAGVPTRAQWEDVIAWTKERGLLSEDVPYDTSVNASYLPKSQ
jgi:NitT/TauT family transport system substrate-binding protein